MPEARYWRVAARQLPHPSLDFDQGDGLWSRIEQPPRRWIGYAFKDRTTVNEVRFKMPWRMRLRMFFRKLLRKDALQPTDVLVQYSNAETPVDAPDDWMPPEETWRDASHIGTAR